MEAADNLLQNKLTPQKLTPRKTTYLACPSHSRGRGRGPMPMFPPSRPAPPPPSPSPRRDYPRAHNENRRDDDEVVVEDDDSQDPASKIWAKIRRYSSGFNGPQGRNLSTSTANSMTASVSQPFSANCATDRGSVRRKKAAVDIDNHHMTQRQRTVGISSKASLTDRTNLSLLDDKAFSSLRRVPKASGKGRRGSGRWSIGNWW